MRSSPYRTIGAHAVQTENKIQKMLELDVIELSHAAWASPIVIVPKKNNVREILDEVIFCVDYRKLNSMNVPDLYLVWIL